MSSYTNPVRLFSVVVILALTWGMASGGIDAQAQDVPSWAEPKEQTERDRSYERDGRTNRRNTDRLTGERSPSPDYNEDVVGPQMSTGGRFQTNSQATLCDPSACGGCPDDETCVDPGNGQGNGQGCKCMPNESGPVREVVPLHPIGALILAFSGLTYGVIGLRRRKGPDAST